LAYKGKFTPKNPKKYKGDPTNIVYRSMWEAKFMQFLDGNDEIKQWASEEISIVYLSPVDGRYHRYFPDFWIRKVVEGKEECAIIEVKPKAQTEAPKPTTNTKSKKYITEVTTYVINQAKFEAATRYCEDRNWKFMVITENELFGRSN